LAAALTAAPATGDELSVALGWDGVDSGADGAAAILVSWAPDLSVALGPVRFGPFAAAQVDLDRDGWIGAGVLASIEPGLSGLRLHASVAPGLYARGNGEDLGGPIEIRSAIGLSLPIAERWRIGIEAAHLSNADIYDSNPGSESVLASVTWTY
jgi:hypothetical protein